MDRYDRLVARLRIGLAVVVVLISGLMVAYHAIGAVTTTSHTTYALRPCSTCREVSYPTLAQCEAAAEAEARRVGLTRTTGSAVYTCISRHNVIATFTANPPPPPPPTCPAVPAPRTQTCPTGTQGTWTQTAAVGPAPTCAVTWSPTTAPTGACTTTPPPPPPPAGGTTLNWTPPTHFARDCMRNPDGTEAGCVGGGPIPAGAITAYRITYNTVGGSRPQVVQVPGTVTRHSLSLSSGNWYFTVKAVAGGNESAPSNVMTRTVQ
jgi:hypothetical protein